MSNRALPMMPWYPDQFAASTAEWSFIESAVYRALLDLQWQNGIISVSRLRLSTALKVRVSTINKVWPVVGKKFAAVDGGLQNFRLEQHRLAALELHKKKSAGGRSRQAQLRALLKDTTKDSSRTPDRTAPASISISNKELPSVGSPRSGARAANGKKAAARAKTETDPGAIREDDPEIRRKRREAEALAAQHAKKKDDDMPF